MLQRNLDSKWTSVSKMEYQYKRLDSSYVDAMLALQQRCWTFDRGIFVLSSRALLERAFQFRNYAFGTFAGEELAGFVTFSIPSSRSRMNLGRHFGLSDEMLDCVAHANTMMIAPERRRQGLGENLFNLAMDALPEEIRWVMTTTRFENALARRLLEKHGFHHGASNGKDDARRAIYVFERPLAGLGAHVPRADVES